MKVVSIVGARPQFVKAAVVSRALRARRGVTEVLVHTGQHYDPNMSGLLFDELGLPVPDHHLGIGSGGHGVQTGRMLIALEGVLVDEGADWVLVYGDTNSTLAGVLAAAKLHQPVAHVEAGLRSFNRLMPEELNRIVTDQLASMLFAPTEAAVANLKREGIADDRIHLVGDVMYDAALEYSAVAQRRSSILGRIGLTKGGFVLATIHRAQNTDDPSRLQAAMQAFALTARRTPVILPLHPRTKRALGTLPDAPGLTILDPVGYLDMLALEASAKLVVTDSGGVQKEAFFFGVPCVTLREETEWVELVTHGWNILGPPVSVDRVLAAIEEGLKLAPGSRPPLFGSGNAVGAIVEALSSSNRTGADQLRS